MSYLFCYPHIRITSSSRIDLIIDLDGKRVCKIDDIYIKYNYFFHKRYIKIDKETDQLLILFANFIQENKFGVVLNEKELSYFDLEEKWEVQYRLDIVEVELSNYTIIRLSQIINAFISLNCKTFILIFLNKIDFNFDELLQVVAALPISLNILIVDTCDFTVDLENLNILAKLKQINSVYYSVKVKEKLNYEIVKGALIDKYFKIQVSSRNYFLSKTHHIYYYGRIFINRLGNYSNSYKSRNDFGFFDCKNPKFVFNNLDFISLWSINRGVITPCKFCEFRNICIDDSLLSYNKVNNCFEMIDYCEFAPKGEINL